MSRHGLFAALIASVILSAGGAAAQEQPGTAAQEQPAAAPAIEAPAPAPGQAAPDAVLPPATHPGATTPTGTAPNETTPAGMGPSTATSLTLPRDLSPWGMFMAADIVVKAVMIGLAFASFVTWTIWLAKSLEILG
ncbi:MAG: tonB-system energizer ExbB, partial [Mesorhizobium sp.]